MVELREDKSSVCGKIISERERLSWGALKLVLDIGEPVRSEKSLIYSWDSQRNGMERIMARLDRVSVSNYMQKGQTGRVSYYVVRGDGVRSGHHPLSCILELAVASPRCSFLKMNSRDFEAAKDQAHEIWHNQPQGTAFFTKMRKVIRFYKGFCKHKAAEFWKRGTRAET